MVISILIYRVLLYHVWNETKITCRTKMVYYKKSLFCYELSMTRKFLSIIIYVIWYIILVSEYLSFYVVFFENLFLYNFFK